MKQCLYIFIFISILSLNGLCQTDNDVLVVNLDDMNSAIVKDLKKNGKVLNIMQRSVDYKRVLRNDGSSGYFLINMQKNKNRSSITSFEYYSLNTEQKYSKSDSNFIALWDFYSSNEIKLQKFSEDFSVDYRCNNFYCATCGIDKAYDLIVYKPKPFIEYFVYPFSGGVDGPLKLEFFRDHYLLVLRKSYNKSLNKMETFVFIFDLKERSLLGELKADDIIDIKVIEDKIYTISDSGTEKKCIIYELGIGNVINARRYIDFNQYINKIY